MGAIGAALVASAVAVIAPVSPAGATVPPQMWVDALRVELPPTPAGTPSAPEVVTVTNRGPGILKGLVVGKPDMDYVDRTTTCGAPLAVGASCTVSFRLNGTLPMLDGEQVWGIPARVRLTAAGGASALISAGGAVVSQPWEQPQLQVTPRQLELGPAPVGGVTASKTVTVRNTSATAVTGLTSLAAFDSRFEVVNSTCPASLAVGASCTYGVRYRPTGPGLPVGHVSAPNAPYNLVTLRGGGPYSVNQAFSRLVMTAFLNRTPTYGEIAAMAKAFDAGTESRLGAVRRYALSEEWTLLFVENLLYNRGIGTVEARQLAKPYVAQLRAGVRSRASVEVEIMSSPEVVAYRGTGTTGGWVDWLYGLYLGRPADPAGRAYWVAKAEASGRQATAAKFYDHLAARRRRVTILYNNALNRLPDPDGLAYWSERIRHDGDVALMINLAMSPEFLRRSQSWPLSDPNEIPD